ncbi:MAG: DUF4276 family protein [Pseudanabaena sp.]
MIRLNIIVEGQTEELFVNNTLVDHLGQFQISTSACRVTTSKAKGKKGGLENYAKVENDINRWLKQQSKQDARFKTMFDLYALPNEFPSFEQANKLLDPYHKVGLLETAFANSINDNRFIPYIQLHEIESLIFTNLEEIYKSFPEYDTYQNEINRLSTECSSYSSPELINQGITTAPSKRLAKVIPRYDKLKTTLAPQVIQKIGLVKIREKCPHFDQWVTRLERLEI